MKIIKKIKKRISKKLKKFLIDNELESVFRALQNSDGSANFFDFSNTDKSKISYWKGGRTPEKSHLYFNKEMRKNKAYHARIGKLISSKVSQRELQKISALLYNRRDNDYNFAITEEICKYYHEDMYARPDNSSGGELHQSCMRYDRCQPWLKAYETMGSDIVKLLVLLDNEGKVLGRALLWYTVSYSDEDIVDGTVYMERVFAIDGNIKELFFQYAKDNGFSHNVHCDMSIEVSIPEDIPLPYFDTFVFYDYDSLNTISGHHMLDQYSGKCLDEINRRECQECGDSYHEDELMFSDVMGEYLCRDCGVYVESEDEIYRRGDCIELYSRGQYRWYLISDDDVIEISGKYYHEQSDDIVYSEYYGEYILAEEAIYVESEDVWFYLDDIVEVEGENYFKDGDQVVFIDWNKTYYLIDDENIVTISGYRCYFHKDDPSVKYNKETDTYTYEEAAVV